MPTTAARDRTDDRAEDATLSPRVERLKKRALEGPCTPIGRRCLAFCEAALAHEHEPLIVRRAHGLARTLETFPTIIHDDELIVGTHLFGEQAGREAGFDFPEMHLHFWCCQYEKLEAGLAETDLTDEQKQTILSLRGQWHRLLGTTRHAPAAPPEVTRAVEAGMVFGWGHCINHSVRDFPKVLNVGFGAIARDVDERLAECRMERPDDLERLNFLRAASAIAHAAAGIGKRYASHARKLATQCDCPERRAELEDTAQVCDRVPARPARTLEEAIQALWFAHAITCAEDNINANSIGRLDQMLWPFYERDLAEGRLDEDGALELLELLWLKLYRDYDVQQAVIGGQTRSGEDATDPLTYLCLEATERLGLVRCMSVRVHRRTPGKLVDRALDLVQQGGGVPFFFNDEAIIPALLDKGIDLEDARDYAIIGCVEVTIPGKTNPHAVSHNTNLAKCLELALFDGRDSRTEEQVGPRTGDPREFRSADDLWRAYAAQAEHVSRCGVFLSNAGDYDQEHTFPVIYHSILTDDCIARGRDITAGGAVYHYHSCSAIGIPNVADSLYAIEELVFERGELSMTELLDALASNFEGQETLRQKLLNAVGKYGNDCDEADRWAARVSEHYCRLMAGHRTRFGGSFHCHLFSFLWNVSPCGNATGALPDGRRAGEPLAYSLSASAGRDRRGLTAFMNSLAKIPHNLAAGSTSAIIEISPSLFRGEGRGKVRSAIQSAIERGVGQMQFNVVTAERLRLAQQDPEKHGNVVVRVSGFSQRFCLVDKPLQDHIIERTKHEA